MTLQIIEITEVHPDDSYFGDNIKGAIFEIDSKDTYTWVNTYYESIRGFSSIDKVFPIGYHNPMKESTVFYAVKYKVLFGVR